MFKLFLKTISLPIVLCFSVTVVTIKGKTRKVSKAIGKNKKSFKSNCLTLSAFCDLLGALCGAALIEERIGNLPVQKSSVWHGRKNPTQFTMEVPTFAVWVLLQKFIFGCFLDVNVWKTWCTQSLGFTLHIQKRWGHSDYPQFLKSQKSTLWMMGNQWWAHHWVSWSHCFRHLCQSNDSVDQSMLSQHYHHGLFWWALSKISFGSAQLACKFQRVETIHTMVFKLFFKTKQSIPNVIANFVVFLVAIGTIQLEAIEFVGHSKLEKKDLWEITSPVPNYEEYKEEHVKSLKLTVFKSCVGAMSPLMEAC